MPSYSRIAAESILPSRFVKQSTTAVGRVMQATAGDRIYGVSQPGTRRASGDIAMDDGYAALVDENLMVYGPPDKDVYLEIGGQVRINDRLESDALGRGVSTTTSGDPVGAVAMQSGALNDIIRVQLVVDRIPSSTLLNSLLAGWKLDEVTGATRTDVLGANNLTDLLVDVPQAAGQVGNAAGPFAAGDQLGCGALLASGAFTFAFWTKRSGATGSTLMVAGQTSGTDSKIHLQVTGASTMLWRAGTGSANATAMSANVWHHIICSYDGATLRIYLDGVLKATSAATGVDYSGTTFSLGLTGNANPLPWLFDETYVWGKALSDGGISTTQTAPAGTEVYNLYQAGLAGVTYPWPGF